MQKKFTRILLSLLICINTQLVQGQSVCISGVLKDSLTNTPLAYCSVKALNQRKGVISDSTGYFSLTLNPGADSLRFSMMGYQTITKPVRLKASHEINLSLAPFTNTLNEVVVYPKGYDPAVHLFKKILQHKAQNNPDRFNSCQSEVYDKLEFDANNISEKAIRSRLLQPFSFVFNHADSTATGKPQVPIFFTESLADYYYSKKLGKEKTIYKARQVTGIKNETIIQYLNDLKQQLNVYNNYLVFLKVSFISPRADNGLGYYKYTIEERKQINHRKYFRLSFKPLHSSSNTFTGECWVMDKTYALQSISLQMNPGANINWVKDIAITQDFTPHTRDSIMAVSKTVVAIDFTTLSKKSLGFTGTRTSYYRNIRINDPMTDTVFQNDSINTTAVSLQPGKQYWEQHRFAPLSTKEQWAYTMIDSIRKVPAYITYSNVITALGTGYYPVGKIDIGNLYKTFTANIVEGARFNFGFRTNANFSKSFQFRGYAGLGMKHYSFKYALSSLFVLDRKNWETVRLSYENDFTPLSDHMNELNENSIFGAIMRRVPRGHIQLVNTEQAKIQYQRYYSNGFSIQLALDKRVLSPAFNTYYTHGKFTPNIVHVSNPRLGKPYQVAEASVSIRYAYQEKIYAGPFSRISLGSKYPIVEFRYTRGFQVHDGALRSDFDYQQYQLSVTHQVNIPSLGKINYALEGGITDGILPILLLNVAKGNDTYYYNRYAFNNMNRYEFVSDRYASLLLEHHWGGFPFNRLPLLKKTNWRTVTSFRALMGSMTDSNKAANRFHDNTLAYHFIVPDKQPYMETGIGIENIFHVLRVDAIWRLSYRDRPGVVNFGLKAALQFNF